MPSVRNQTVHRVCAEVALLPLPSNGIKPDVFCVVNAQEVAGGTVKNYLHAARHSQVALGLRDPHIRTFCWLEYVIKGLKRSTANNLWRRLPITLEIMVKLRKVWQQNQVSVTLKKG